MAKRRRNPSNTAVAALAALGIAAAGTAWWVTRDKPKDKSKKPKKGYRTVKCDAGEVYVFDKVLTSAQDDAFLKAHSGQAMVAVIVNDAPVPKDLIDEACLQLEVFRASDEGAAAGDAIALSLVFTPLEDQFTDNYAMVLGMDDINEGEPATVFFAPTPALSLQETSQLILEALLKAVEPKTAQPPPVPPPEPPPLVPPQPPPLVPAPPPPPLAPQPA